MVDKRGVRTAAITAKPLSATVAARWERFQKIPAQTLRLVGTGRGSTATSDFFIGAPLLVWALSRPDNEN